MANLDTSAALTAVKTFLDARQLNCVLGVPESFTTGVAAYAAVGSREIRDHASGHMIQIRQGIFVGIGYRVKGAEATVEAQLAAKLDEVTLHFYANRRDGTGVFTVASDVELDFSLQNDPRYQVIAGQEFRIYPIVFWFKARVVITA